MLECDELSPEGRYKPVVENCANENRMTGHLRCLELAPLTRQYCVGGLNPWYPTGRTVAVAGRLSMPYEAPPGAGRKNGQVSPGEDLDYV